MATMGRPVWWIADRYSTGTAGESKLTKAVRNRADKAPPEVLMKIAEDKVPPKKRIVRLGKRS